METLMSVLSALLSQTWIYAGGFLGLGFLIWITNKWTGVMVFIKNDEYGVVEKLWSLGGSVKSGFMSLNKEAGFEPDLIRGGLHFFPPWQYRIHRQQMITVQSLAYVYARDGKPLPAGQTLAQTPDGVFFEDARGFLTGGGQRGPQRQIVRQGVYAFNTALFVVMTGDKVYAIDVGSDGEALDLMRRTIEDRNGFEPVIIRDTDDVIGIVTVHDGPVLEHGAIIAPAVGMDRNNLHTFHNSFQDIDHFLAAGGWRGRQEQVLVEGTYWINRLFATVETRPKKVVAIGTVGVVISYTGDSGVDVSGDDYKHGSLVDRGRRGVWADPVPPGKYPFNPFAYNVIDVPTTNFVLRWIEGRREDHGLDSNLAEIRLITKDAFEPILPLSIVVHISPENAPKLIQQFADVKRLVDQTIDPMVSAYFKDAAQNMTMLQLINDRSKLQDEAKLAMRSRFASYNIDIQEVLIGTPRAQEGDDRIETLLDQIRGRQLAAEQQETYGAQRKAAGEQQKLNEATAAAAQQTALTESMIQITVSENQGKAALMRRQQEAQGIRVTAEANAFQTVQEGESKAKAVQAIGVAEGAAIAAKVEAFTGEGARWQIQQTIAEILGQAIQKSSQPLVPHVMIAGGDGAEGGAGANANVLTALMALALENRGVTPRAPSV
jgi:uncharacterized membrane protein YqiK